QINGHGVQAIIDSGAAMNAISTKFQKQMRIPCRKKRKPYGLTVVNGSPLPGTGRVTQETRPLEMTIQQHHEEIILDVLDMASHDVVIGLPWLKRWNPRINWVTHRIEFELSRSVTRRQPKHRQRTMLDDREFCYTVKNPEPADRRQRGTLGTAPTRIQRANHKPEVTKGNDDTFVLPKEYQKWAWLLKEETGANALPKHQPWDHEIKLEDGKKPPFGPIYGMSEGELKEVRRYLDENLRKGFIRPSESPARSPVLFAKKKDGTLRFCVDYRALNNITIKDRYPLPNAKELRSRLGRAKYFTKLDLRGAYNLVRIKEGEEWKTAFGTRYGHYETLVMPFGLTNAPATCQRMVNDTIRYALDIFAMAYLDDILIYSETLQEHIGHVRQVLQSLAERRLFLKPEKCTFHAREVEFLGYIIGTNGMRIDPAKIRSLQDWPTPTNLKEVLGFLGFSNYNRIFVEKYSEKARPLTELSKKDNGFRWDTAQQKAFELLKQAQLEDPVLAMFEPSRESRIETDASDFAIGAVYSQKQDDGKWHPVAYYSRSLTAPERNYDIHDKELLAIVAAMQEWRIYIEGAPPIEILTDHKNLVTFTTTK
ncbi:MAG TPA: retropepsin-like aspartic protease/reverse transcriptase, partial [Candidatus Caenarcaniphilales bacterium]